jgi:uncharacterized protein with ATP-grasp and redox domains
MKFAQPCVLCQRLFAERTLEQAGMDKSLIPAEAEKICRKVYGRWRSTPAHYGTFIFKQVQEISGKLDPYGEAKKNQNRKGASILPVLREKIKESGDPLHMALKISAIGNVIDLGSGADYNFENDLSKLDTLTFAVDDSRLLARDIETSKSLLLIADNCGEIFFDRVLLEVIAERIPGIYVGVKSAPIINDATMADAVEAGLDVIARIVETGSDYLGCPRDNVSEEFKQLLMSADIVIGKGHANTETLDEWDRGVYLLLKAKCDVVADFLGIRKGELALKYHK